MVIFSKSLCSPILATKLSFWVAFIFNKLTADEWKNKLEKCILSFDTDVVVKAMQFKFENKTKNFSFIDCVGYILAKENNLTFLTGDKEFESLKNVEFVK